MRILGLDISSTTIGYSILETDQNYCKPKLIKLSYIKPPKKGSLFERLHKTKLEVLSIIEEYSPDFVAIEEIVKFMGRNSTAQTIITLASFNRMVGLTCYEHFGQEPLYYPVITIRSKLKLGKELPQKEEMPALTAKHLGRKFPFVYKKGTKEPKVESYDMADGLAVALCCYYDLKKNWGEWIVGQKSNGH